MKSYLDSIFVRIIWRDPFDLLRALVDSHLKFKFECMFRCYVTLISGAVAFLHAVYVSAFSEVRSRYWSQPVGHCSLDIFKWPEKIDQSHYNHPAFLLYLCGASQIGFSSRI